MQHFFKAVSKMPRGNIPDRWIPYNACGTVIEGTRIICFKVPLHKRVQVNVPGITKIWDIPAIIEEIPNLGAVIDLTNTARYYNPKELEEANVSHKKILMPGREIPPENKVLEFMDAVDEFLGKDCDKVVGVHCTHGLNRTGYMVCRYMRDRMNIPSEVAIKRFQEARGYEIERNIYIAALNNKKLPPPDIDWNIARSRNKNNVHPATKKATTNNIQPEHNTHIRPEEKSQLDDENPGRKRKRYRSKNKNKNKKRNKNKSEPKPKKRKIY